MENSTLLVEFSDAVKWGEGKKKKKQLNTFLNTLSPPLEPLTVPLKAGVSNQSPGARALV